jgi:hypothetical protein
MPGNPPSIDTEREAPVVYLRQQRDGYRATDRLTVNLGSCATISV